MSIAQNYVPVHGQDSFLEKSYVCTALKGFDAEQRARALDVAAAYKRRLADKEWKEALEGIRKVMGERDGEEEDQRVSRHLTLHPSAPITPLGRPLPAKTASAPVMPFATFPLRAPFTRSMPPGLTRINTTITSSPLSHVSTPRTRWDIIPCGPITPLSPTPVGNAFASDGFWSSLTPKLETPVTAVHHEPFSPFVPSDPEAKEAYDRVKSDVNKLARGICATRLNYRASFGEDHFFPKSLIRSKDELLAAQVAVQMRQLDCKKTMGLDLMDRLAECMDEEKMVREKYTERCSAELQEREREKGKGKEKEEMLTTSIADMRAEKLTAVHRRKFSLLALPDGALELVWATRILEDMEYLVSMRDDASSTYSDEDEGYDYSNFMRSIKREVSLTSTVETSTSTGEEMDEKRIDRRSSPSPSKETHSLLRQSWSPQTSSTATNMTPPPHQPPTGGPSKRTKHDLPLRSLVSRTGSPQPRAIPPHSPVSLPTDNPTPSVKEFRHRAPNILDLSTWARELAKLDDSSPSPPPKPTLHSAFCVQNQDSSSFMCMATSSPSPCPPQAPPSPWKIQKQHLEDKLLTGAIPLPPSPGVFTSRLSSSLFSNWDDGRESEGTDGEISRRGRGVEKGGG